jgi:hypothetical protein
MTEEAEACFVLPLREAAAHFACRNAKSAEAPEMGGSNDSSRLFALGTGIVPFFSKHLSMWFWLIVILCRVGLRPGREFRKRIESEGVETIIRCGILGFLITR